MRHESGRKLEQQSENLKKVSDVSANVVFAAPEELIQKKSSRPSPRKGKSMIPHVENYDDKLLEQANLTPKQQTVYQMVKEGKTYAEIRKTAKAKPTDILRSIERRVERAAIKADTTKQVDTIGEYSVARSEGLSTPKRIPQQSPGERLAKIANFPQATADRAKLTPRQRELYTLAKEGKRFDEIKDIIGTKTVYVLGTLSNKLDTFRDQPDYRRLEELARTRQEQGGRRRPPEKKTEQKADVVVSKRKSFVRSTPRQKEVMTLTMQGFSTKEICEKLNIQAEDSVNKHRFKLRQNLQRAGYPTEKFELALLSLGLVKREDVLKDFDQKRLQTLTNREKQIIELKINNLHKTATNKEIQTQVKIDYRTIEKDMSSAREKTGAKNTTHLLILYAAAQGETWQKKNKLQAREKDIKPLTARQKEILNLLAEGKTEDYIANRFNIHSTSLESTLKNIQAKLRAHNNVEAVLKGMDSQQISNDTRLTKFSIQAFEHITDEDKRLLNTLTKKNGAYSDMETLHKLLGREISTVYTRISDLLGKVHAQNIVQLAAMYQEYILFFESD